MVWAQVDSHIESRTYKEGQIVVDDDLSILLNKVVDTCSGEASCNTRWNDILYDGGGIKLGTKRFLTQWIGKI